MKPHSLHRYLQWPSVCSGEPHASHSSQSGSRRISAVAVEARLDASDTTFSTFSTSTSAPPDEPLSARRASRAARVRCHAGIRPSTGHSRSRPCYDRAMSDSTKSAGPVVVTHYSDVLCVWAYVSQVRLDELRRRYPGRVAVRSRLCSVFADVGTKIVAGWRDRGGVAGYRRHVEGVVSGFGHVKLHDDAWAEIVPTTSATPHAAVTAAALVAGGGTDESGRTPAERLAWRLRTAFFAEGRDVSREDVQLEAAAEAGLPVDALRSALRDGRAWAALLRDYEDAAAEQVRGSPTLVLNERRQVLYGNVGYRVIEANVEELLREPSGEDASWC